jgi:hypothetical protein
MFKNFLKILPLGVVLPLMIGAASVKPEDAISNLAEWAHWLGFHQVPDWLADPSADRKVIFGSIAFALFYSGLIWGGPLLWMKIKKRSRAADVAVMSKLERDVSLPDAIWRVFLGRWGERINLPKHDFKDRRVYRFVVVCSEIRQAAFDGKLPIWATRQRSYLFEPLPQEFWRNREIIPDVSMHPDFEEVWVRFTHALAVGDVPFAMSSEWERFMTSKDAVDQLWPQNAACYLD